jgi:protein required for attachment to host cells
MAHPKITFVLADGATARWVARDHETQAFRTVREARFQERPPLAQGGTVHESAAHGRHGLHERSAAADRRREAFAAELAEQLNRQVVRADEILALVAPPRMLNALRARLSAPARSKLAASLSKDLTKVPDGQLGDWLVPLELKAGASAEA